MLIIKQNEQQKTAHLNISINIPVGNDTMKNLQKRVLNMSCQRKKEKKKLNDEFIAVPKPIKEEVDETSSILLNRNICQDIKDVGAYVSFVNELEASENEISAEQLLNCSDTSSPLDIMHEANPQVHVAHNIIDHDVHENKRRANITRYGEMPFSDIYKLNENTLNTTQTRLKGSFENIKDSYINAQNKTSNLKGNKLKHKFNGINLCEKASNPTEIIHERDVEYGKSIFGKISDEQENNNENAENTKQISESNTSCNNIQVAEVEPMKSKNSTFQLTAKTSDCGKDISVAYEEQKLVSDEMSSFVNKLAESSLQKGKNMSNNICNKESTSNHFFTSNTDLREEHSSSLLTKVSSLKNNCVLISNSPIKTSNEKESTSTDDDNFEKTQQTSISSKNKSKATVEKKMELSENIGLESHEGSSETTYNDTVLKTLDKFRNSKLRAPGNTNTAEDHNNEFYQNKYDEIKYNKYNPEKNNLRTGNINCSSNSEKIVDSKEKIAIGNIEPIGNDSNCSLKRNLSNCIDDKQYTNKKRNLRNLYSQASKRNKMLQVEELSHIEPHNSKNMKSGNKLKKPSIKLCSIKQYFPIMNTSSKLDKGKEKAEQNYSAANAVNKTDDIPNIKLNESSFSVKNSSKQTKMNSHKYISLVKTYKHGNVQEESYSNKLNNTQDTTTNGQMECVEKIDVEDTNKRKLKSKQRNDMRNIHENVTHLQHDDLSDDEEGNFSNIMSFLKNYVDHENNFQTKKTKSKPPVKSGTNKLSSNNKLDFDSSNNYSSDSSIDEYTAQFNKAHREHNIKKISVDKKKGYCKLLSKKEIDFTKKQNQVSKNINSKTSRKNNANKNDDNLESPIKNVNSHHQNCFTANEYTAQFDEAHHDHNTKNTSVGKKKSYCKLLSKKEIDFTKKQNQVSKSINFKTSRKNANKNDKLESPIKNVNSHHIHQNWFTVNGLEAESSQSCAEDKMSKINNSENKSLKTKAFKITKEKHTPTKCSKNGHDSINKSNEIEDGISSELAEFGNNKGNTTVVKQFSENLKSNSKKLCTVLKSEKTQKNGKRLILDYFDRVLTERYENRSVPTNAEFILDSDGSSNGIRDGISDFETDKGSDSEECKNKILKIISYADDDLLTIFEENELLRDLRINIYWDVPISHTIETRISSCPTKAQQQLFEDLTIRIKHGPFTKLEDEAIKKNFQQFCMEHGLRHDPAPFLNFRYGKITILKKTERIKFARYLGRGLENRKLFCIYSRFKVLYSTFSKGRFTPAEDAVILEYMKLINNGTKHFSSLSKILRRPRPAIEKRYRLLQRGSQILKPKDYPLFVKTLMEITNIDSLESLRDRFITDTEWSTVSKKMNVCRNHLKVCWKSSLYTKIFHNGPIQVDNIMRKLIAKLDETEEDDYRKLNWTKLAEPFKPVTRAFLYRIFKRVQSNKVPPHMHTNLRKCVVYLKSLYEKNEMVMSNIKNVVLEL